MYIHHDCPLYCQSCLPACISIGLWPVHLQCTCKRHLQRTVCEIRLSVQVLSSCLCTHCGATSTPPCCALPSVLLSHHLVVLYHLCCCHTIVQPAVSAVSPCCSTLLSWQCTCYQQQHCLSPVTPTRTQSTPLCGYIHILLTTLHVFTAATLQLTYSTTSLLQQHCCRDSSTLINRVTCFLLSYDADSA